MEFLTFYEIIKVDELVKSPRSIIARSPAERGDEAMTPFLTFYEAIKVDDSIKIVK